MTTHKEALKLALEALDKTDSECGSKAWEREMEAITAIKEALAQPKQEPHFFNLTVKVRGTNQVLDITGLYNDTVFVDLPSQPKEPEQEPVAKAMTAHRAAYFMERFKHEEKLLGPNEQAALDFVISMLEAQPEQEPVGMYRNKCADGSRCLHGCHTNESCFTSSQPQPEQEAVECDCNQGQSCHVCDPYFPFDSAPQTTRLTQKTTTNDVAIGVDVTEDGTHVTAMRMRPDGINIVIYSQFHPLAQPEQEPVAEGWCDGCNPDNCQGCGPAAKPKHEPIFWYRPVGEDGGYEGPIHNGAIEKARKLSGVWKPLYTTPPQRKPLTDEQIDAAIKGSKKVDTGYAGWVRDQRREFARAIEAAHGIKE